MRSVRVSFGGFHKASLRLASLTINVQTQAQTGIPKVPISLQAHTKRLRVLHVVSSLGVGGTEHGVLKVIRELGDSDFEHEICAVRGIDQEFAHRMNIEVKHTSVGTSALGFQFPLFRLKAVMKSFQPHIVHSRNFGSLEAVPAARLAGVPVVIHSEHGYELEILSGLPLRRRVLCRAFYAMTDQVFTVSEDLKNYHSKQSWLPAEKFKVIHNGVNTSVFCPRPEESAAFRGDLGIPPDCVVIGSVGRLVPIKNYETLLAAAEILVKRGENVQVVIAGAGPELGRLRAMAQASADFCNRVRFLGPSDRIDRILSAMDIFVLPSICEGMSNTVLEAMATGLPTVVTNVGGNSDLVQDGITGFLFQPREVDSLATKLSLLVKSTHLRRLVGAAARQRALRKFDLALMVQRYRELYRDLASRRGILREN